MKTRQFLITFHTKNRSPPHCYTQFWEIKRKRILTLNIKYNEKNHFSTRYRLNCDGVQ